jgi:hypothetical protein
VVEVPDELTTLRGEFMQSLWAAAATIADHRAPVSISERSQNGEAPQLRAGERRMLQALARHYPMKVTRAQLGTLAQFAPSGGAFSAYFGNLKRHG